jgi:hypothetical protein
MTPSLAVLCGVRRRSAADWAGRLASVVRLFCLARERRLLHDLDRRAAWAAEAQRAPTLAAATEAAVARCSLAGRPARPPYPLEANDRIDLGPRSEPWCR